MLARALRPIPSLVPLLAALAPAAVALQEPPSYPDGFGTDTPGGRGGEVLRVTTLASEGPGSLRAALRAKGERIIVFEVGGVIDLERKDVTVESPYLTVAGETAPSPGITLVRGGIRLKTSHAIVRHLRVRPGDAGEPKGSGWQPAGLVVVGHHVWIDHCSFTWGVEENAGVGGPRDAGAEEASHDVTFSDCLFAEALHDASHAQGAHSKGSLVMDGAWNVAYLRNVFAHNHRRNPLFKGGTSGVLVNNLVYAPGESVVQLIDTGHGKVLGRPRISAVGNLLLSGPDGPNALTLLAGKGDAFLDGNLALDAKGRKLAIAPEGVRQVDELDVWCHGVPVLDVHGLEAALLATAGARPADRDAIDARILREVAERGGRLIDSQEQVGGYPAPEPTRRPLEVPGEGVEAWLAGFRQEVE